MVIPRFLVGAWKPVLLLASCAALVASIGPVAGAAVPHASKAVTQNRTFSCPGVAFHAPDFNTHIDYSGTEVYRADNQGGVSHSGFVICNAALPTRAAVTKVVFDVKDASAQGALRFCGLYRLSINGRSGGASQELAQIAASATTGEQQLVDTSITNSTIDNGKFAYWLQCDLEVADGPNLGLYGAKVAYSITPADG